MKYAFIVLVACYLLVWGCGPDNSKKADEQKSQVTHSKVEKAPAPAPTPEAAKPVPEKPTVAATRAQEKSAPTPEPVAAPPLTPPSTTAQPAQIEKAPMPCDMAGKHPPAVPETEEQQLVTLPCGMVVPKERIPADAPCLQEKMVPCPMMHGRPHPPIDEMVIMPCGRPCFRHPALPMGHPDIYGAERGQLPEPLTDANDEPSQDLATAMQKMVETTNDMVVVTRQLVVATQEMVRATQEVAYQAQQPQAAAPGKEKPAPAKGDPTAAMHEAVLATQKALEALNKVLPKVLEQRQ